VDWEKKELNNIYLHETIFHKTTLRDFLSHELHHKFDNKFKDKAWSILINEVKLEEKNRGIPFVLKYIFFNIRSEALPAIMDFPHKVKFKRNSIRSFRSRILELAKYEIDKVTVFIESSGKSEKEKLKMSLYYKAVLDDSEDDKNLNALYKKFAEDWYTSRSITHDIAIYTSFIIAYSQMDPSTVIHTSGLKVNNLVAAIDNGFIINSPSEQIIRNTYRMIKESDVLGYIKLFEGAARKLNLPNKLIPISVAIYHKLIKECVRINQEMIDCIKKEGKLVIEHHDLSLREFKDIVHQ
jgi:hypothetical protein